MNSERRQRRRVCEIRVEPYLAIYARRKFGSDSRTGGIVIPVQYELHHAVWHAMERRPLGAVLPQEPNLTIHLPYHRPVPEWQPAKDPAFWNYISPRGQRAIEQTLRRLFNWEFHHWMEEKPLGMTDKERLRAFVRSYGLGIDSEDTLMKNWQRYLRTMRVLLNLGNGRKVRK